MAEVNVPTRPVAFVGAKQGEVLKLGPIRCRIMEDGSNSAHSRLLQDNRIGVAEFTLPPGMKGPPMHWHEMHDEMFYTTKGTIRYHVIPTDAQPESTIDAHVGDFVSVPVRAPHTFSNASDTEEAVFINTYTPAFYINYFKLLASMIGDGPMTPEKNAEAMSRFATLPVPKSYIEAHVG